MALRDTVGRLLGMDSGETDDRAGARDDPDGDPSHVCESCGEAYYTEPEMEIGTCRNCGGVKVRSTRAQPAE